MTKMNRLLLAFLLLHPALVHAQMVLLDRQADGESPGVNVLRGSYGMAVSPDGLNVYASGSLDNGLVVFSLDPGSGTLAPLQELIDGQNGITSLAGVRDAAVSPDGLHVYSAALSDSAVSVFARAPGSGTLTLVQAIFDLNTGGSFDGLGGAMSVLVSPDGAHVYVGARSDDAVVAFARDSGSGMLTLIAVYQNMVPPVVGLDAPESIVISPDGNHLYAAAETSQALVGFTRNPATGALSYLNTWFDGVGGVDGLGCVNDLEISPDGKHVYAVGQFGAPSQPFCTVGFDDWMGIFSRNTSSGELSFVAAPNPDDFGLPINCGGVAGDNGVAVAPDNGRVYATVQWLAALVEMDRDSTSGLLNLRSFQCADLSDPDTVVDLISAHEISIASSGSPVLVSALSPGTVLSYEPVLHVDGFETLTPLLPGR